MRARSFPETRKKPKARILLIPFALIVGGSLLVYLHPWLSTGFFGIVISLAGAISLFLVGMVFADLWASSSLARSAQKARAAADASGNEEVSSFDPFEDELETDK